MIVGSWSNLSFVIANKAPLSLLYLKDSILPGPPAQTPNNPWTLDYSAHIYSRLFWQLNQAPNFVFSIHCTPVYSHVLGKVICWNYTMYIFFNFENFSGTWKPFDESKASMVPHTFCKPIIPCGHHTTLDNQNTNCSSCFYLHRSL